MSKYEYVDGQFVTKDYLAHYGVKGMKWGVRRSGAALAGAKLAGAGLAVVASRGYRKMRNKQRDTNRNKNYTDTMVKRDSLNKPYYRNADSFTYDVNRAMNKGMNHKEARDYAKKRAKTIRRVNNTAVGAIVTHQVLTSAGKLKRLNNGTIDAIDYAAKVGSQSARKRSRKRESKRNHFDLSASYNKL